MPEAYGRPRQKRVKGRQSRDQAAQSAMGANCQSEWRRKCRIGIPCRCARQWRRRFWTTLCCVVWSGSCRDWPTIFDRTEVDFNEAFNPPCERAH